MKDFKGTKGEWVADSKLYDFPISSDHKIDVQTNNSVIELNFECSISEEEVLANAQLIAAAPELLESCQWIVTDFEGDYVLDGEIVDNPSETLIYNYHKAKKAINKALGE